MQIVIKRSDGGVSIMGLDPRGDAARAVESAPEQIDLIVETEIAQMMHAHPEFTVVSWRIMPDEAIPEDRTFRNGWADTTPELTIDFDMPKCRNIWRDKMRQARAPLLAALDTEYMRADEVKDAQSKFSIAKAKQNLRNVTSLPEIEAAQTPDELKAIWPDVLKSG